MFYKQKLFLNDFLNYLPDITKTKLIAKEYSKNWWGNEPVILAVDACSVNPNVSIFSDGTTYGLIEKYQMNKDLLTQSSTTILVLDEFVNRRFILCILCTTIKSITRQFYASYCSIEWWERK